MRLMISAFLLISLTGSPVLAEEEAAAGSRNFKVNISVISKASEAKGMLYDCVEESLGSENDIDIVMDNSHDYAIFIMLDEVNAENGKTLVVAPDFITRLREPKMLMERVDQKYRATYEDFFSMLYFYPKRSLFTVAADEVPLACEIVVNQFTSHVLKMTRQLQPEGRSLLPIH